MRVRPQGERQRQTDGKTGRDRETWTETDRDIERLSEKAMRREEEADSHAKSCNKRRRQGDTSR